MADLTDPPIPPGQQPWPRTPAEPPSWAPPPGPPPSGAGSPPRTVPFGVPVEGPYGVPPPAPAGPPGRNPVPPPSGSPRLLRKELGLVLLLAFAPSLLGLLLLLTLGPAGTGAGEAEVAPALIGIVIQLFISWSPVLVIGYLLARNREGWPGIGLTRFRAGDLGMGLLLWVASFILVLVLAQFFQYFGTREVDFLPEGPPLWFRSLQAVLIAVTAGVTEEIVVRGYAQTRLEQLRASTPLILLLPTALWAVFHVYQGLGAALTIFGLGLMYAWYFQRTRRLWPLILAHVLFDMTQLVFILTGV